MGLSLQNLLVPIDFGESSNEALATAVELSLKLGANLTLVHVYEIPAYVYSGMTYATADLFAPIEEAARNHLDETLAKVKERIPEARGVLRRGVPAQEILAVIEQAHPDLVVMGTHGRQGVSRVLLGSVAERIIRLSTVPVLTVRGAKRA